jgi:hypothetical protein
MASFTDMAGAFGAPHGGAALTFAGIARNATGDVAGTYLSERFTTWYIPACALAGLLFALYQAARVSAVRVHSTALDEDDTEALLGPAGEHDGARRAASGASCMKPPPA